MLSLETLDLSDPATGYDLGEEALEPSRRVFPRKGGGGPKGSGGPKGGRVSSGNSGTSSVSGKTGSSSHSITVGGTEKTASSTSNGGGKPETIATGRFAGAQSGGATRGQVYGSSYYGSGYGSYCPGWHGVLSDCRDLPFGYWPLVWATGAVLIGAAATAAYLHLDKIGSSDDHERPGGPMVWVEFEDAPKTTSIKLVADNSTVLSLADSILASNCSATNTTALVPRPLDPNNPSIPHPEQVVQYYRASSVALALDGYVNNITTGNDPNATRTPYPQEVNGTFVSCINETIGISVPLLNVGVKTLPSNLSRMLLLGFLLVWFASLA